MHNEFPVPRCFLADDATSADQLALSVLENLGSGVLTLDVGRFSQQEMPSDGSRSWVINAGTREVAQAEADHRNRTLAACLKSGQTDLPIVQIDSRLRGIGKALRGLYDVLQFDFMLFVPAEPELGRLAQNGCYYHVEDGKLVPFHLSTLAKSAERPPAGSELREFVGAELGIAVDKVVSIGAGVVAAGTAAVADAMRSHTRKGKCVIVPDVTTEDDFGAISAALQKLGGAWTLVAGSRTFLRGHLRSVGSADKVGPTTLTLAQALDRQRRSAPLAVICSLEAATNAQVAYARQALGPNLVTLVFEPGALRAGGPATESEVQRVQGLVTQSLKAMRPVLLQSARAPATDDPALQQKLLDAIGRVVAGEELLRHVSALFLSGGHTAETLRRAVNIPAIEIKGAFAASIPWGMPMEGPLQHIPIVTKGGRLGSESVLFDFFEQGHPLPRANVLPVITPLTPRKQIDEAGIERLVHYLANLGTTDIFAVGNAGEFRFLSNEQRLQAIEAFVRNARGRLRVFAGITGDSADETRRNYEAAAKLGVYAAVVMPLYFLKSSDELVPFVQSLPCSSPRLPLILYNNPERTGGQNISFEAVEALAFPVVAIKDSSGDLARVDRYASVMPVYEGQQRQFWEGYQHGVRGTIGIIGHASPLPNEFYAPTSTDARRAEIAKAINDLSKKVKQGGAEVAAYKFLLSLMRVTGDTVASTEAARELTPEQRELIREKNSELIPIAGVNPLG